MGFEIKQISRKEEIQQVLNLFAPCLQSLQIGRVNIEEQADKFSKYACVLVLEINNIMVGFASSYYNDAVNQKAFLSMIAVSPRFRGAGYGKILIKETEERARKQGMRTIELEVNQSNQTAKLFYERMNYQICSRDDKKGILVLMKTL